MIGIWREGVEKILQRENFSGEIVENVLIIK